MFTVDEDCRNLPINNEMPPVYPTFDFIMPVNSYANPPVHEVVLDVQFPEPVSEDAILEAPNSIPSSFGVARRVSQTETRLAFSSSGQHQAEQHETFAFWRFETVEDSTRWHLIVGPKQLTLSALRSEKWPFGPYVGWDAIESRLGQVLNLTRSLYESHDPKRAGLRYLNRMAVPESTTPRDWLKVVLSAPKILEAPLTYNLRQMWPEIAGHEHLSVGLAVARIEIEDEELKHGHQGILLDIDIFNYWIKNAPDFNDLENWFSEAHEVENQLFEDSITDKLRERFTQ